jgi:ABC-type antimicrobial peptide transport system permease subunit
MLAIIGLYGLISHEVETSTRDIGVRMALGATRLRILGVVYSRVGLMLSGGLIAGLMMTWAARSLISSIIAISVEHDVAVVSALAASLLLAGMLAAYFPARRAATVDPMESLRND